MSDAPLSLELRRALDGFAPPPQAGGFAARALARVEARDAAALPPLPRLARRWRSANPWRRAGLIVGGVASLSLVSAAAAATGVFGEPIHVPVISRIAQSLDLVPAAAEEREPELAQSAPEAPPATTREKLDRVIDDPAFRALPPAERRAELRKTARGMVQSGEATRREVVTALRETTRERIAEMTPEQREQVREAVAAKREEIAEMTPQERRLARRARIAERRAQLAGETGEGEPNEGSDAPVR